MQLRAHLVTNVACRFWQNPEYFSGATAMYSVKEIYFENCFSEACLGASIVEKSNASQNSASKQPFVPLLWSACRDRSVVIFAIASPHESRSL